MSTDNATFLEQENESKALLNDILDCLNHVPNTTHMVNSINYLNKITVPMVGAKNIGLGYTENANGVEGFVPAPLSTEASKFLRGDGTWQTVITSIDPLQTEPLSYDNTTTDAQAYPYVQPSNDTSGYVGTLKYNKNLSFGRANRNIEGGNVIRTYTTLDITQGTKLDSSGNNTIRDTAITFKSASASGGSSTLLANLSSLGTNHVYAKMPTKSGTLLTDAGFTVNGDVVVSKSYLFVGEDAQGIGIQSTTGDYASKIIFGATRGQYNNRGQTWYISADSSKFRIAFADAKNSSNGSLWIDNTSEAGSWYLTNNLTVSNNIFSGALSVNTTISAGNQISVGGDNYKTYISGQYAMHTTNLTSIVYKSDSGQVNLLSGTNSIFYVNALAVCPLNGKGTGTNPTLEGGEIQLQPRQNESYGTVIIDNYNGMCRIWNNKDTTSVLRIDSTKNNDYTSRSVIRAEAFDVNAYSVMSVEGVVHLKQSSVGINLKADGTDSGQTKHIDASVPMSTTATSTPVGTGNRYYRPITISNTAPASSDPNNTYGYPGDVWIQYS